MKRQELLEAAMVWCIGATMGLAYAAVHAYPVEQVALTGSEPAWVGHVITVTVVTVAGATAAMAGALYENRRVKA